RPNTRPRMDYALISPIRRTYRRVDEGRSMGDSDRSTRLLTALAHDIRTPLNAMLITTTLLERKLAAHLDDEDRADFTLLRSTIWAILDLHRDILDQARLADGRVDLEPTEFALDDALASCIQVVRPHATQKGLTIVADLGVGAVVRSDRGMVHH